MKRIHTFYIASNNDFWFGLDGGGVGAPGRQWVERSDGGRNPLTGTDRIELAPGDVFVIETPGGGGYGLPGG